MKIKADQSKSPKFYTIEQIAESLHASTRSGGAGSLTGFSSHTASTGWSGFPRRISRPF
jgi:hypothetical protein